VVAIAADDFRRLTESLGALKTEVKRSLGAQTGYVNFLNWVQHDAELLNHRADEWMSSPAETLSPEMTLEETVRRFHRGRPGYPIPIPTAYWSATVAAPSSMLRCAP
jgi:hypothetical protein